MATNYNVKIKDKLLRFDTTKDDVIVWLLPFAQTPNAPYEVHKTSYGDGHTVTIQPASGSRDFLLPNGANVVLDDTNNTAIIRIPANGSSPAFVSMGGVSSGGGGGTTNVPAPDVSIVGPAEIFFRDNNQLEVDVEWAKASNATAVNFQGVHVYLEDPDISTGSNVPLDGTALLDGTGQASGQWTPVLVNDSTTSPAVLLFDATSPGTPAIRNVRIYLAAYGPYSQPKLVRANTTGASPNILVEIAQGPSSYQSGMEWAFNVTDPHVEVTRDYNRPDPQYSLTFTYTPPDPGTPLPKGVNQFGGCRIVFVQEDSSGNPIFPGADSGYSVPVAQSQTGFKTPTATAGAGGLQFRAYFCSEDNAQPLGSHINSLVEGVTPYVEVSVPLVAPAPDVTNFAISAEQVIWLLSGAFVAQANFSWSLPAASAGGVRYAGVFLYLVKVTGSAPPLSTFPAKLTGQQSNVDTSFILDIANVPANPEVWTIAAISVDVNGHLSDTPANYGQPSFHSPTVTWSIGPPAAGTPGGGQENAPLVTINSGATVTSTQTVSADGVGMVSFEVGSWTDPTSNQFGGAKVAMVINNDPTKPTYWDAGNATSFATPAMPSFGNVGASVPVDFYIVSYDPQGEQNSLKPGTTPVIHYTYTPAAGAIIPARSGWFSNEFVWPTSGQFSAQQFAAEKILVGSQLIVGGAPSSFAGNSPGDGQNGQIAVLNAGGTLVAWIGESIPGQGTGQGTTRVYGGWFGQLYVGGTNPLDAPIFIDSNGIVQVGGIAAAKNTSYPYISIRDQSGVEAGRIGAKLSMVTGLPGDGAGSAPPQLTAGAWFTQLAVGGSNLSNWNVLITPTTTGNPLGSDFYMRNIYLLSIDYAAQSGTPSRNEYKLDFGTSVWMAAGLSGQWQFPGIHIYEVDGGGNNFGATFINRGMVLRGTQNQNYPVLVSLTTWNGDQGGSDIPAQFFGILAMGSPLTPDTQNVVIASGSYSGGVTNGSAYMTLANQNGTVYFSVDQAGNCTATSFSTVAHGQVIDSAGNWHGQPIAGSQTPWASNIAGAGFSLSNVGSLQVNGATTTGSLAIGSTGDGINGAGTVTGSQYFVGGTQVINTGAQWVQSVLTAQGITCGSLAINGGGNYGEIDCGHIVMENIGAGVAPNIPAAVLIQCNGSGTRITCASNGIWSGNGVQTNSDIYSGRFGIEAGGAAGASSNFLGLTANSGNQFTLTTSIGNLTVRIIGGLICAG